MSAFKTEQEEFWGGRFGDEYIDRNSSDTLLTSKISSWAQMLRCANNVRSALEFGCNIGLNLIALKRLRPNLALSGIEINQRAAEIANQISGVDVVCGSILENMRDDKFDITFMHGVLIHINPIYLELVYENLYRMSNRFVLVAEYYNPTPLSVKYRGNEDKLFKRDFSGDLIDKYNMKLIDYGFIYKRDNWAPQDDITWFLLEKQQKANQDLLLLESV